MRIPMAKPHCARYQPGAAIASLFAQCRRSREQTPALFLRRRAASSDWQESSDASAEETGWNSSAWRTFRRHTGPVDTGLSTHYSLEKAANSSDLSTGRGGTRTRTPVAREGILSPLGHFQRSKRVKTLRKPPRKPWPKPWPENWKTTPTLPVSSPSGPTYPKRGESCSAPPPRRWRGSCRGRGSGYGPRVALRG